jgi:hypothetical protein
MIFWGIHFDFTLLKSIRFFMKKFLLILTILLISQLTFAQNFNRFVDFSDSLPKNDTSKLHFSIQNLNFFRNNEYFNNFYEGYTLIGYFLKPEIVWQPYTNFKISGGAHFQKYSGIEGFTQIAPTFSVSYQPFQNAEIRLGTLDNSGNHGLDDQIYFTERFLTQNIENGLQLKYQSTRIKTDTWLNWEQFIFHGSNYPERLTFGTSNQIILNPNSSKYRYSFDLQSIITHRGGQINENKQPILSIANFLFGLNCDFKLNKLNIRLKENYLTFTDISPSKNLPYLSGYSIVSGVDIRYKNIEANLNHRYGKFFISSRGNPLYMSISEDISGYKEPFRAFFVGNLMYAKEVYQGLKLGLGFESYYDLYNKTLDYTYSFYISFNFINTISKK